MESCLSRAAARFMQTVMVFVETTRRPFIRSFHVPAEGLLLPLLAAVAAARLGVPPAALSLDIIFLILTPRPVCSCLSTTPEARHGRHMPVCERPRLPLC
jgi:hypothetical protein